MGMNRNIGSFMGMNANNGRFMAFHPDQAGSCRIRRAYPEGTRRSGWIGMHWDALGCSLVHRDASQFTGVDTGFGTGTGEQLQMLRCMGRRERPDLTIYSNPCMGSHMTSDSSSAHRFIHRRYHLLLCSSLAIYSGIML